MASPKMAISEAPSSIAGDHPPSTKKIEHRKTMSTRRPGLSRNWAPAMSCATTTDRRSLIYYENEPGRSLHWLCHGAATRQTQTNVWRCLVILQTAKPPTMRETDGLVARRFAASRRPGRFDELEACFHRPR